MNAFIGLAAVDQVTLATVAPGIAEALLQLRSVYLQQFLLYLLLTTIPLKAKRFIQIVRFLPKKWWHFTTSVCWIAQEDA
jgi:hypothetical protein